jgi:hypothetical protein
MTIYCIIGWDDFDENKCCGFECPWNLFIYIVPKTGETIFLMSLLACRKVSYVIKIEKIV